MPSFKDALSGMKKAALIAATPLFYGFNKLLKSLNNVLNSYKPVRSFIRALAIFSATIGGAFVGAALGTALLPGVGTVIGALLGAILGSSVGAYVAKGFMRALSWLSYTIGFETPLNTKNIALLESLNLTNQEKYSIPPDSYKTFQDFFDIRPNHNLEKITILGKQLAAIKKAKNNLGFASSFWGTQAQNKKNEYNKLLAAIKKEPIPAVLENKVKVGHSIYLWKVADDEGVWEKDTQVQPFQGQAFRLD